MIRQVERLRTHLNSLALRDGECTRQRHVELEHAWALHVIQAEVAISAKRGQGEGGSINPMRRVLITRVNLVRAEKISGLRRCGGQGPVGAGNDAEELCRLDLENRGDLPIAR